MGVDTACVERDNTLVVVGVLAVVAAIFAALFALASGSLFALIRCAGFPWQHQACQDTVAIDVGMRLAWRPWPGLFRGRDALVFP